LPGDCNATFFQSIQRGNGNNTIDAVNETHKMLAQMNLMRVYPGTDFNYSICAYSVRELPNGLGGLGCFLTGPHNRSQFSMRHYEDLGNQRFGSGPTGMQNMIAGQNWMQYGSYFGITGSNENGVPRNLLTPVQALAIDGKGDDGQPGSGEIRGYEQIEVDNTSADCLDGDNFNPATLYNNSENSEICVMSFYFQYAGQVSK
jgi:hypothetical protein